MKILIMVLLSLFLSGGAFASAADSAAVARARSQQNAAIARHDVDAIAAFWTDDVTLCRGLGAQIAGKAGYRKLLEEDVPGSPEGIVYERVPTSIDVGSPWPLAFETGIWKGHRGAGRVGCRSGDEVGALIVGHCTSPAS